MESWSINLAEYLWRGALVATLPALLIALIARWVPSRPATRHALWLTALTWFVAAPLLPSGPFAWHWPTATTDTECNAKQMASSNDVSLFDTIRNYQFLALQKPAPTPPRTDARTDVSAPHLLAQAACEGERRSIDSQSGDLLPTLVSTGDFFLPPEPQPACAPELSTECSPKPLELAAGTDFRLPSAIPEPVLHQQDVSSMSLAPIDELRVIQPSAVANFLRSLFAQARAHWMQIALAAWLGGAMLLLILRVVGSSLFLTRLRWGNACTNEVTNMVARTAREIGLAHPPRAAMVTNRISPMVCCIGKRNLLLPESLWAQLDNPGREAILFHELAHLKRKDHWVRWGESLVTILYWWHPVVWWVRRRLSEEAENCCDAWVTWLMPQGRRAYAEALLQTSKFISGDEPSTPVVGIGVIGVRARRFARRLTMVMTQNTRPRISSSGVALAALFAVIGWFATPAWSHPKDGEDKHVKQETPCDDEAPVAGDEMPEPPMAPDESPELNEVFNFVDQGAAMIQGFVDADDDDDASMDADDDDDDNDGGDRDVEDRLGRLERRLEELTARLHGAGGEVHVRTPAPRAMGGTLPRSPMLPRTPVPAASAGRVQVLNDEGKETRTYSVSRGKLDALLSLMSRDDVPIMVSGGGDSINVVATPAQHRVFDAFIKMIDPTNKGSTPTAAYGIRRTAPARAAVPATPALPHWNSSSNVWTDERTLKQKAKIEQKAEEIRQRGEELRQRGEEIRQRGEELRRRSSNQGEATEDMKAQAEDMKRQAEDLAREGAELGRMGAELGRAQREQEVASRGKGQARGAGSSKGGREASAADAYNKGFQLHNDGKYEEARKYFQQSAEGGYSKGASLYNIACGYSRLGDKDRAFQYLQKGWEAGYRDVGHMREDEDLVNIRNDKRFAEIVSQAKHKDKDDDEDD